MDLPVATESFYAFMREREAVRLRKESGQPLPWTDDPILQEYKFTNVRRYHDWTTDMFRTHFYSDHFSDDHHSILMNCAVARYFGTFEFMQAVGWQDYNDFDFWHIEDTAADRMASGERVFTGAYVITNQGISAPKQEVVVHHFLKDLHEQVPTLLGIVQMTRSWRQVAEAMSKIKGFGGTGFMTKEILLDTMMTGFWSDDVEYSHNRSFTYPTDYREWTPIGPGGLRGAARLLGNDTPSHNSVRAQRALEVIMEVQAAQANRSYWPEEYGYLYPTDIQFQFCEFDKYERVRLGQGKPRSKYRPRLI